MKKVGRYEIISELGRGAMGIVYKASDPTIGREVALKVISLSSSPGEGTGGPQQMFMREVQAAGRLAHPSIVTIHDAFDDKENQTSCIVMELVPGKTLEKILESGHALTIEQSLSLARQVAAGLDYAHRNQVIHRDLKPANILVTEDGHAKITDFGIAKVLVREGMARTVGLLGTPSHMSPEQVKGGEVDGRTDIFSLGIILFTMLTGTKPFAGNTATVMFKIVYEEAAAPSALQPQLTSDYDFVAMKCLAKDRNQRYASARELLGDLDDLQRGLPPRSRVAASAPPAAAAPPVDRTPAMPIPILAKATPQGTPPRVPSAVPAPASPPHLPAPPPRPVSPPPAAPATPAAIDQTMAMPIPGLMKGTAQPMRGAVSAPPAAPRVPAPPPKPTTDARPLTGQTLPMRVPDLSALGPLPSSPQPPAPAPPVSNPPPPAAQPLTGQTLPMRVPDLSTLSRSAGPSQTPVPAPPVSPAAPLYERTQQAPDLSAVTRQAPSPPRPEHALPIPPGAPPRERPVPVQRPDFPATSLAAAESDVPVPLDEHFAAEAPKPAPTDAVETAHKSKLLPAIAGGVAVVVLAAATWGYWRFHTRTPQPPSPAAVQAPAAIPPTAPAAPPVESPAPAPLVTAQAAAPASRPPDVARKPMVRKPKQAMAPEPPAPVPQPAPTEPVAAIPPPKPATPAPSAEAVAKAEVAKLARIPRVVQVVCNFGFKEATFVFSAGNQNLFEHPLKGKKKKGGFLGIKGSYQGTFAQTITVPAAASEVSVHVLAKDGATDVTKTIKMPPSGGFVPTLNVEADGEHVSLNWNGSSAVN